MKKQTETGVCVCVGGGGGGGWSLGTRLPYTHHVASLEYPVEGQVAVALMERPRVVGSLGIEGPLRGVHEVAETGPGQVVHPVQGTWEERHKN